MSENNIGISEALALGSVISQLTANELLLNESKLSDEGLIKFVYSLGECMIQRLELGSSDIHAAGLLALVKYIFSEMITHLS